MCKSAVRTCGKNNSAGITCTSHFHILVQFAKVPRSQKYVYSKNR
jgi:hypothetical protein